MSADEQLDRLQRLLADEKGPGADLVQAHRMMLRSPEIAGESRRLILEECSAAEWAVTRALDKVRAAFARVADPYFRERGGDFESVGERLLRTLLGLPESRTDQAGVGSVAIAVDLAPLDPFHLRAAGVVAIVSENGGSSSHAAIVARALELPYVVGVKQLAGHVVSGTVIIVDGAQGDVIVAPTEETRQAYRARSGLLQQRAAQLLLERDLPATTTDGIRINLAANVESLVGVAGVREAGADGIGLFRTEFLYLERPDLPTEDEQYQDALSVLKAVDGAPVTFRTLDLGGDKLPLSIEMPRGPNPALGVRSIRFSIERPEIFRTQLRALYRASASGPMRIMLPLISSSTELRRALAICTARAARPEGRRRGVRSSCSRRHHARDPQRGRDRRSSGQAGRLLQHRHERPHSIRLRRRSRERGRRASAQPASARNPSSVEGRPSKPLRARTSQCRCAATWPAIRRSPGFCWGWGCETFPWSRTRFRW